MKDVAAPALPEITAERRLAQGHRGIAQGWMKRGRMQQAVRALERALDVEPDYPDAVLDMGRLLMALHRWADLVAFCSRKLRTLQRLSALHKLLITGLEEQGSIDDAFRCYEMVRVDEHDLSVQPGEILCCVAVRNERPRLRAFLNHYRRLGVNRFLFVDNGSGDGTAEWLMSQRDVHVWRSLLTFEHANFGSSWFELLLRRYGIDHWCLTVDVDELLVYQGYPERSLHAFCRDLESRDCRAASGVLLDMYSDRPIRETHCDEGIDPLAACGYFDRRFCHTRDERGGQYQNQAIFFGGVRQRIFPAEHSYLLSKVPLLFYRPDVILDGGQHLTNTPYAHIAHEQVCLLHFKFLASFPAYAREEAVREVHAMGAEQYKAYAAGLSGNDALTLYSPELSVRFESIEQLQKLRVLKPEPVTTPARFPPIAPVTSTPNRPFWSVMITIYRRLENLERVVGSVLQQASPDMQIEVINDGAEPEIQRELSTRLRRIAGDRVPLHTPAENLGHPHIFNLCLERARGEWVHILHDDDWVEPGFYATLRDGIARAPEVGAAFCQHSIVMAQRDGPIVWRSWLERDTPGIVHDWLARIAVECRVQFSAMTVRRSVYESLGGFSPDAGSAFDWEMWKRIAVSHPVWYVPETLASIGRDGTAESSRLLRSGAQVADSLRTVEISRGYLPSDDAERLSDKAREHFCLYALDVARQFLATGDEKAALANIRAALAAPPSVRVTRVLMEVLKGVSDEFCS